MLSGSGSNWMPFDICVSLSFLGTSRSSVEKFILFCFSVFFYYLSQYQNDLTVSVKRNRFLTFNLRHRAVIFQTYLTI